MVETPRNLLKLLKTYKWMKSVRCVPLQKMEDLLYGLGCGLTQRGSSHDTYQHEQLSKAPRHYFPQIVLGQQEERDVIEVVKRDPMGKDNVKRILEKVKVIFRMYGVTENDL